MGLLRSFFDYLRRPIDLQKIRDSLGVLGRPGLVDFDPDLPPNPMSYNTFNEWDGRCPDCGGASWERGPQGGNSVNLMCLSCGTWVNAFQVDEQQFAHKLHRKGPIR